MTRACRPGKWIGMAMLVGATALTSASRSVAQPAQPKPVAVVAPFTAKNIGEEYILTQILNDVCKIDQDQRRHYRYFSLNHIMAELGTRPGVDRLMAAKALDDHRNALALAVNHLSWQPKLVVPMSVDPGTDSIYRVDLRELGWSETPYKESPLNLFDLVLLDYPYGRASHNSPTFDRIVTDFLSPAQQARPVAYVRSDWFVSVAMQPPLYYDLLQLPRLMKVLEEQLGVDREANVKSRKTQRAGLEVSNVSPNNRVVERHATEKGGYLWIAYDFDSRDAKKNLFTDPIALKPVGGEVIFSLPNGLQGYWISSDFVKEPGHRLDEAPKAIVTDANAKDQVMRGGLSCIRCHTEGIKAFEDNVAKALLNLQSQQSKPGFDLAHARDLYPGAQVMQREVDADQKRFTDALGNLPAGHTGLSAFARAAKAYLENPLDLYMASAELGLKPDDLKAIIKMPRFAGLSQLASDGNVRREEWDAQYPLLIRELGNGFPLQPLDGIAGRNVGSDADLSRVEMDSRSESTGQPVKTYRVGEKYRMVITNKSKAPVNVELVAGGLRGERIVISPPCVLKPGEELFYPPKEKSPITVKPTPGKDTISLYASFGPLNRGIDYRQGKNVSDRVYHPFYGLDKSNGPLQVKDGPIVIRKTLLLETPGTETRPLPKP